MTIVSPQFHHIGVAVKSVEKGIEYYSSNFNLGPFGVIESSRTGALVHGKPTNYKIKQAFAQMGSILFELNEVVEGKTIQTEFIEKKGEGVHHLGFLVDDLDAEVARYQERGFSVMQRYTTPNKGVSFAFMDTDKLGGIVHELVWLPENLRTGVPGLIDSTPAKG